jgi:heavy metal sensor kinase
VRAPIKLRLTAWYVLLLGMILAGLSAFLLVRLKTDLMGGIDRGLESQATQVALAIGKGRKADFQDVSDASIPTSRRAMETVAQVLSATDVVVQSSDDPLAQHPIVGVGAIHRALTAGASLMTAPLGSDQETFRILVAPVPPRGDVIVAAQSLEQLQRSVHDLLVLILLAGPLALAIAASGGWWLARKALRPVATMARRADAIGVDRLEERVAVPRTRDELAHLARTLNSMLERIGHGVAEQRRLVADASHELRTPLAVMRSELEVALRSPSVDGEAREVLRSSLEEVDRMSRTMENLLTLARIDEGRLQLLLGPVDLLELATNVAEDLRPLAEARRIRLEVRGEPTAVIADRERLYQALTNLVENALKYSRPEGDVGVSVWRRDGESGLTVTDHGPGIPPGLRSRVFDRFFRIDPSRSSGAGGSGLGLAICAEIMKAHRGRAWTESEPGRGSRFSLALPSPHQEEPMPVSGSVAATVKP